MGFRVCAQVRNITIMLLHAHMCMFVLYTRVANADTE